MHRKEGLKRFIAGAITPDIPYFFGAAWLYVQGKGLGNFMKVAHLPVVEPVAYFFHSVIIWLMAAGVSYFLIKTALPFTLGWGLHILIDLFTHVSDVTPVFWPLSNVKIHGVLSYWERNKYGIPFAFINGLLILLFLVLILYPRITKAFRRKK